jgi:hypothetical protein
MKQKTFADTALGITTFLMAVVFLVSVIWLAKKPYWLASAFILLATLVTWALATLMQVRAEGRLDEVELSAARFGGRWGLVAGVVFVVTLTYLPPIQSLLVELGAAFASTSGYPRAVEPRLFMFGVVCTFIAQELFRSLLAAAWKWSKR